MKNLRSNTGANYASVAADYTSDEAISKFNTRAKLAGVLRVVFSLFILTLIIGAIVVISKTGVAV